MSGNKKKTSKVKKNKGYQRNFLKSVIFRIDFPKVNLNFLERFYSEIQAGFPFQSKEDVLNVLFQNPKEEKIEKDDLQTTVWTFHNATKSKKIQISYDNIVIEYQKYSNKEELIKDVSVLIPKFIEYAKIETINRLGLRYVNQVDLNEIKKNFTWDKYVSIDLLGMLKFVEKDKNSKLTRAIGKVVFKKEKADIGFNFGVFNSDFPNESIRKEFTLDYDAYSLFPLSPQEQDIIDVVKTYNIYIENLFESSISNELRKILRKK